MGIAVVQEDLFPSCDNKQKFTLHCMYCNHQDINIWALMYLIIWFDHSWFDSLIWFGHSYRYSNMLQNSVFWSVKQYTFYYMVNKTSAVFVCPLIFSCKLLIGKTLCVLPKILSQVGKGDAAFPPRNTFSEIKNTASMKWLLQIHKYSNSVNLGCSFISAVSYVQIKQTPILASLVGYM